MMALQTKTILRAELSVKIEARTPRMRKTRKVYIAPARTSEKALGAKAANNSSREDAVMNRNPILRALVRPFDVLSKVETSGLKCRLTTTILMISLMMMKITNLEEAPSNI